MSPKEDPLANPQICERCQQVVPSPPGPPDIAPSPDNLICAECGSAEVECLDWVRVNDSYFIGGNESMPAGDFWCPDCNIHEKPVTAREFCEMRGHRDSPCRICGANSRTAGVCAVCGSKELEPAVWCPTCRQHYRRVCQVDPKGQCLVHDQPATSCQK